MSSKRITKHARFKKMHPYNSSTHSRKCKKLNHNRSNSSIGKRKKVIKWHQNFSKNDQTFKATNFNILLPKDIVVDFNSLFGHKECKSELESLLHFLKNPGIYNEFNESPHYRYMITGVDGIGKETLICAVAKEAGLPIFIIEPTIFYNIEGFEEELDILFDSIRGILSVAPNCLVLLKELQYLFTLEQNIYMTFIGILMKYMRAFPELVMFTTLSATVINIPQILLDSSGFTKIINLDPPESNVRKRALEFFLSQTPIAKELDINKLVLDTYQMTISDIKELIKNVKLLALKNNAKQITYQHFSEALSETEFGYRNNNLDEEERLLTARHESGHVISQYFSDPDNYKISKVDIAPRAHYLGITITNVEEKHTYFPKDLETQIIGALGGMAAEEHYYGSTSTGVANDLKQATEIAVLMHKVYGMSKNIGPISLIEDGLVSSVLDEKADEAIQHFLKNKYYETLKLVKSHSDKLDKLVNALLEKEVLYREEIISILNS